MQKEFQVGVITRTHGLRGELKVYETSSEPRRFEDLSEVTLKGKGITKKVEIERVRYFKDTTILKFKGIDDVDEAYRYLHCEIVIPREDAIPLEENEYYIGDLIGCRVYLEDGTEFGVLTDVLETGANDVYDVRTAEGKSVLIPAIRECILDVKPEEERIVIHLMEGLI